VRRDGPRIDLDGTSELDWNHIVDAWQKGHVPDTLSGMKAAPTVCDPPLERILETVRRYWGFDRLRPLQEEAIRAALCRRDSLVVMPTGGGKSLCYQVPPVVAGRTDVVASPLISLMKDQVDALQACGYAAVAVHSGMTPDARRKAEGDVAAGRCHIVFVAPERLLSAGFMRLIERVKVGTFAIDEAHCISHWGHDFRPEYRRLAALKQRWPDAGVNAYTATATKRVQHDIAEQLGLKDPVTLVGRFDRPNLVYRVTPRVDIEAQVREVVERHRGEAVIVYCITRNDTERLAADLSGHRIRAEAYHAGMNADQRRRTQDAFAQEQLDVVVATVAFGMGIDRSNVRCVIHTAMPKSVEHYQQETGRAGRDSLEAECILFYSASDVIRWESLIRRSAEEAENSEEVATAALQLLKQMRRFYTSMHCRHRSLSEYFGQVYDQPNCGACDVCLDEIEGMTDATVAAQKILSCVARVGECFGVGHVVEVLRGADSERIRQLGHQRLSTHGLMKETGAKPLTNMIYQLIDQGLLGRTEGDRPVLVLNEDSWEVLRAERKVRLLQPKTKPVKTARAAEVSWAGVDLGLFEHLRGVRRELAHARGMPAFVIFGDATLREMARLRPGSREALRRVRGVGDQKLRDFASRFLTEISAYCKDQGLDLDTGD
jgi:ATP-dependent DNA helicase RecQ